MLRVYFLQITVNHFFVNSGLTKLVSKYASEKMMLSFRWKECSPGWAQGPHEWVQEVINEDIALLNYHCPRQRQTAACRQKETRSFPSVLQSPEEMCNQGLAVWYSSALWMKLLIPHTCVWTWAKTLSVPVILPWRWERNEGCSDLLGPQRCAPYRGTVSSGSSCNYSVPPCI